MKERNVAANTRPARTFGVCSHTTTEMEERRNTLTFKDTMEQVEIKQQLQITIHSSFQELYITVPYPDHPKSYTPAAQNCDGCTVVIRIIDNA